MTSTLTSTMKPPCWTTCSPILTSSRQRTKPNSRLKAFNTIAQGRGEASFTSLTAALGNFPLALQALKGRNKLLQKSNAATIVLQLFQNDWDNSSTMGSHAPPNNRGTCLACIYRLQPLTDQHRAVVGCDARHDDRPEGVRPRKPRAQPWESVADQSPFKAQRATTRGGPVRNCRATPAVPIRVRVRTGHGPWGLGRIDRGRFPSGLFPARRDRVAALRSPTPTIPPSQKARSWAFACCPFGATSVGPKGQGF